MNQGTITTIQGQALTLDLAFTNNDGSPYNLTGCTIELAVCRTSAGNSTPVISADATITNASSGLAAIGITTEDTSIAMRLWWYQVTLIDSGGASHPSGFYPWIVSDGGDQTTSMGIVISSNNLNVGIEIAGAPGPAGQGVPTGGTAGQVLTKNSGTNYDASWDTPSPGAVSSVFGRTGAVTPHTGDYTASQVGADPAGSAATAQSTAESFATSAVATETTRAEAAEGTNATAISNEAATRSSADTTLQNNINAEASTRASADTTNANAITAETSRAEVVEATKASKGLAIAMAIALG